MPRITTRVTDLVGVSAADLGDSDSDRDSDGLRARGHRGPASIAAFHRGGAVLSRITSSVESSIRSESMKSPWSRRTSAWTASCASCSSGWRTVVSKGVIQVDSVVDALSRLASTMPMGPGLEEGNVLGPLQNQRQFDIVSRLIDEARSGGAKVVTGGAPAEGLGPLFYQPTVVVDIADDASLVVEEQFGPVIPVLRYFDIDDAVARANSSSQGLGASVWSADIDAALDVAARLQAGTVWINQHGALNPQVPFGGTKQSGYGQEFGVAGLKAVAAPKVISR